MSKLLYTGTDWSIDKIDKTWSVIDKIAKEEWGFDYYDTQMDIITFEHMLDCYSSVAMPVMYPHWKFGKSFIENKKAYESGRQGLAYEVVINTDPCLVYLMESNSMTLQTLVMAHAGVGHNTVFKNNYLFKEWTKAGNIIDYLVYAKEYIEKCEQKYGVYHVEMILDACHALQYFGVDKYKRDRTDLKPKDISDRIDTLYKASIENEDVLAEILPRWNVLYKNRTDVNLQTLREKLEEKNFKRDVYPEENLLYFIETRGNLANWEREIIHIIRNIAQYFYPQMQTKLLHEGAASFVHYEMMVELYDRGYIDEAAYMEFIYHHTNVVCQRDYNQQGYSGINVYALGFAMFRDIKRICLAPNDEDRKWFPDICNTDWRETFTDIISNYRDESFVRQFLSMNVVRDLKLFTLKDDNEKDYYEVIHTADDERLRALRKSLSKQYDLSYQLPQLEVLKYDGESKEITLLHHVVDDVKLDMRKSTQALLYLKRLLKGRKDCDDNLEITLVDKHQINQY